MQQASFSKDFELLRGSLKERTKPEYKRALRGFVYYCKDQDIEIYSTAIFDELMEGHVHHVIRDPGLDGKGHGNKLLR